MRPVGECILPQEWLLSQTAADQDAGAHAVQILDYLEAYTEHFGFRRHISFRTEVVSILPSLNNVVTVTTKVRSISSAPPSGYTAPSICTAASETHSSLSSVHTVDYTVWRCPTPLARTLAACLKLAVDACKVRAPSSKQS